MLDHMKKREPEGQPIDGYEVYHWPEFKALCERLGVEWGLPTSVISIRLEEGKAPLIMQEYHGRDFHDAVEARSVETTNCHNEQWRTRDLRPAVPHPDKLL